MSHPFTTTLWNVSRQGYHFEDAAKILEDQLDDIRLKIEKFKLEDAKPLKVFAIETLRAIRDKEGKIWEAHDQAYCKAQEIQPKMKFIREKKDFDQYNYWLGISEYYAGIINQIDDAKYTLMEYLAKYHAEECARNESNIELMKSILPAWNLERKKVLSLSKSREINKVKSANGGKKKGLNKYEKFKQWIAKTKFPLLEHKTTARDHFHRLINDKGFQISEKTAINYRDKYLDENELGK